jgi:hypothetical protein
MFYKYTFYKLYKWSRFGENDFYPHLGATYLLTLLILSNAYFILVLLDKFQIFKFNGDFIYSISAKILIAVFVSMLLFNHLYFFWINKWRDIINYFKNHNIPTKVKLLSNIYIVFSILSFLIIYFFNL